MSTAKAKITGRQIAAARELLDLTQTELAEAAGIGRVTLALLERNRHAPRGSTLEKLTKALEERGVRFRNGDKPTIELDRGKDLSAI